jgi:hypothetical protein
MAFYIGGSTVINNSRQIYSGESNAPYANLQGYFNSSGWRIDDLYRYPTYTDDHANNCRGYLPNGNCYGNPQYDVPNGNWWTWGLVNCLCANPAGFDGAGGVTYAYYPVSVNYVYDGYYTLYDRIRGAEIHRNYSHCNCNSGLYGVGNCQSNCNCNCDCDCACNCNCNCNC